MTLIVLLESPLVRWIKQVLPGRQKKIKMIEEFVLPRKILESMTTTIFCLFFSLLYPKKNIKTEGVTF